ncbi:hypothetical protein [Vibrio parahaemolyticus]|uniref:hypothetical protein n=1 Tax=Vibrio parahaemolyticus TaxID=670 RepID=UPI0023622A45|nr:hypothetical protein [Vibrio parahaemolyticus]
MTTKDTQQTEIVVDPTQLSPVDQVTDKAQQAEDFQPKIIAILDKIESNTSALLRRESIAGGKTSVQAPSSSKTATNTVLDRYQSSTNKALIGQVVTSTDTTLSQGNVATRSANKTQAHALAGENKTPDTSIQQSKHEQSHKELTHEQRSAISKQRSNASVIEQQDQKSEQSNQIADVTSASSTDKVSQKDQADHQTLSHDKQSPQSSVDVAPTGQNKRKPDARTKQEPTPVKQAVPISNNETASQGEAPSATASQQAQEEQKEKRERSGLLKTVGDVFKKAAEEREELEAGDTATDAAGSAMGGSLWEAAKEVKEATDDVKNSSLGQKIIEKVTGKKSDEDEESDTSTPKEAVAKENKKGPVRDERGRFIKQSEATSVVNQRKEDTHKTLNQYQSNTNKQSEGSENTLSQKDRETHATASAQNIDGHSNSKVPTESKSTHVVLDRYQTNTHNERDRTTEKQTNTSHIPERSEQTHREVSSHKQASVTSANVVKEREQVRSNEAIADRLDEQVELSQDQHKELIKTIEKKEFGGESGGSLMDSVSDLTDMFGGGDGKEKGGSKRGRGKGRKGRLGSLFDRLKGTKSASATNASALKSAPTSRLGKVAQGVKNATGSLANTGVGKAAGGALKTVGSVASRAAAPVAALATGYFKYNEVKDREDLTGSQKAVQVGATTAGSLGGASAGAAMGAAMGSVVPVVGTLIGGLLGAAVGGWLGSKGGDVVGEAVSDRMEGTDGKTRAEREAEALQSAEKSSESATTNTDNTDNSELTTNNNESAQALATNSKDQMHSTNASAAISSQASETTVMPEQLKATLPEISPSKAALHQATTKETRTEKTETVAKIDEKKLGKAIVDAMNKSQQQSGVSAGSSGPRYAASQSKSASVPAPIKTEFEDKTLVLMAHDRI